MALEINAAPSQVKTSSQSTELQGSNSQVAASLQRTAKDAQTRQLEARQQAEAQMDLNRDRLEAMAREMNQTMLAFNRRLSYTVNNDLDMVVVKVIEKDTDKVIKELPPKELQRLHKGLKEAMGLLVDQEI